jgi:hypothetical protein
MSQAPGNRSHVDACTDELGSREVPEIVETNIAVTEAVKNPVTLSGRNGLHPLTWGEKTNASGPIDTSA